jgi:hypothetical protein
MQRVVALVSVCLSATIVLAQTPSVGPFMGMPLHLTVGPGTRGPAATVLPVPVTYVKDSGFVDLAATAAPPVASEPNFTAAALFAANAAGGVLPPGFRIGSLSSGLNYVFANPSTRVVDMAGRWGGLLFSVSRMTNGSPGSLIEMERASPGAAGADLFSLILPGSTLPASMSCFPIAIPQRATDGSQMGFTAPVGNPPEMTDFDPFISMYDDGPTVRSLLPDDPWIFFSLPTTVATNPAFDLWYYRGTTPLPIAKAGGTILRTQWLSTAATPHWSVPEIHMTYLDLALGPTEEIDALAVDDGQNLLLFSLKYDVTATRPNSDRQLMIAAWVGSPSDTPVAPPVPYKYDAGGGSLVNVADLTGQGSNGDIDAICETDPGNGPVPLSHAYVHACTPASTGSLFPTGLSCSVFMRRPTGAGITSYAASVDGCGGVTDIPGLLVLVVGLPSPQGAAFPPGGVLTPYFVQPSPAGWQTQTFNLARSNPQVPSATWGASLDFIWAAFGSSSVVLSTISRIRI